MKNNKMWRVETTLNTIDRLTRPFVEFFNVPTGFSSIPIYSIFNQSFNNLLMGGEW